MIGTSDDSEDSANMLLAPVREGELVANKYLAGRVLGVGGMGVVLAATDNMLDRKVAIKFLLPNLASSDRAVQRFVREARAATRITSEHVVRLLEIDTLPSGMPYFVMEYLEGKDLRAVLGERGSLPLVRAADYLLQALEAIAEGHLSGVIHRDLKPSNLFVTRRADGTPLVKVLDFGIAKTLERDGSEQVGLTGSDDTRLGSPAYMSPEQLQNPNEVDARSDIWALGVTLYELVCGSHPFRGNTYADLVLSVTTSKPEPPSVRRSDLGLPAELDKVVLRCLEKDRSRRYATAAELAADLSPMGTDHARASLKRISGLRPPSGTSEEAPYTTTLAAEEPPRSPKPPSNRDTTAPHGARRVAGAAVVAIIAAGVVGFAWSRRNAVAPEAPAVEKSDPVVSPAAAAAPVPEVKTAIEEDAGAARPERSESPERTVPGPTVPARSAVATPVRTANRSVAVTPVASAEPASPPPAESTQPSLSRSQVIEKLIEKRR